MRVDKLLVSPQEHMYILEDDTVIKLSWSNPARSQQELFSVGQVVSFLPQDIYHKSFSFEEVYKPITEAKESPMVNNYSVYYKGIIKSVETLPFSLTTFTSSEDLRKVLFNETLSLDGLVFLIEKCLSL